MLLKKITVHGWPYMDDRTWMVNVMNKFYSDFKYIN